MVVAAVVAAIGLVVVAASARPGDGRVETAVALPVAAAVAAWSPPAAPALLAGAGLAYLALVAIEDRTLWYGRWLRAVATVIGAVVPLGTLSGAAILGAGLPHPELWLAGAVVPGVLAYDLRRQPSARRRSIAAGGASVFLSLAVTGIVLRATVAAAPIDRAVLAPAGPATALPLFALAPVLLAGVVAGSLARWRYGLHAGVLSVPLVATWSLAGPGVPLAYLLAAVAAAAAVRVGRSWLRLSGRRLAAVAGLAGATVGGVAGAFGALALPALAAGVLAAEDVRLLWDHAGADRRHAASLGVGLAVLLAATLAVATGTSAVPAPALAAAGLVGLVVAGRVVVVRERARPAEAQLRAAERRWVP